jgi:hypothetical protein
MISSYFLYGINTVEEERCNEEEARYKESYRSDEYRD